ncbi:hypothetical protein V7127_02450 [Bacillus sp. JJ1773]|uniref:hypothetical protein n=1 Tax=Bacillus sp. JJ1773 TaxID=3122965 RepID=UPI002FFD7F18
MSSIRKLYENAIKYEESTLAHYIAHLLQEGKVKLEDDESTIDFKLADHDRVQQMINKNELGFSNVKPFALKYSNNSFVFVYANNQQEAIELFQRTLRTRPKNCHEYSMDFVIEKGNRFISFRDLKKEFTKFPDLIGFYEREIAYQ